MKGIKVGVICLMALLSSVGGPLLSLVENQTLPQNATAQAAGDLYGITDPDPGRSDGSSELLLALGGQCAGSVPDVAAFMIVYNSSPEKAKNSSPILYHHVFNCMYQLALNQVTDINKNYQEALINLRYLFIPDPKIDGTSSTNANYTVINNALAFTTQNNSSSIAGRDGLKTWTDFTIIRSHINTDISFLDKLTKLMNTMRPPNYGDASKDPEYNLDVPDNTKSGPWRKDQTMVFEENTNYLQDLKDIPGYLKGTVDPGNSDNFTDKSANAFGNTVEGFVKVYKKLLYDLDYKELALVKKLGDANVQANASATAAGPARCGAVGSLDIVGTFMQSFCGVVISVSTLSESLLNSSAQLLAGTSGIPGGDGSGLFGPLLTSTQGKELHTPLQNTLIDSGSDASRSVQKAYQLVLDLLNTVLIVGFIAIALANILQIQVNTYSIKKLLPGLIIGFIVAHFSFFAVRAGLELSGQASNLFLQQSLFNKSCESPTDQSPCGIHAFVKVFSSVSQAPNGDTSLVKDGQPDPAKIVQQIFLDLFVLVASVMMFILGFLFLIRFVIFFFLIPLAPLAFFGLFFTPLSFAWSRWSKLVTGWLFMPTVSMFWIWLAFVWFQSVGGTGTGFFTYLIAYVFGIVALYLATRTPFQMAGEAKFLVDRWNGLGKSAWQKTGGASAGTAADLAGYSTVKNKFIPGIKERMKLNSEKFKAAGPINKVVSKYSEKISQNTEQGKGLLAENERRLKAEVKEYMLSKDKFADREAKLEHLKEMTGELEVALKDEIKARKTNLQNQDIQYQEEYNQSQARKIKKNYESEISETVRGDKLFNFLKELDLAEGKNGVLHKRLKASVQTEVRKKREGFHMNEVTAEYLRDKSDRDYLTFFHNDPTLLSDELKPEAIQRAKRLFKGQDTQAVRNYVGALQNGTPAGDPDIKALYQAIKTEVPGEFINFDISVETEKRVAVGLKEYGAGQVKEVIDEKKVKFVADKKDNQKYFYASGAAHMPEKPDMQQAAHVSALSDRILRGKIDAQEAAAFGENVATAHSSAQQALKKMDENNQEVDDTFAYTRLMSNYKKGDNIAVQMKIRLPDGTSKAIGETDEYKDHMNTLRAQGKVDAQGNVVDNTFRAARIAVEYLPTIPKEIDAAKLGKDMQDSGFLNYYGLNASIATNPTLVGQYSAPPIGGDINRSFKPIPQPAQTKTPIAKTKTPIAKTKTPIAQTKTEAENPNPGGGAEPPTLN